MQAVMRHLAIQAATLAVRTIRETDQPTEPRIRRSSPEEPDGTSQIGPTLNKTAF